MATKSMVHEFEITMYIMHAQTNICILWSLLVGFRGLKIWASAISKILAAGLFYACNISILNCYTNIN